MQYRPSGFQVLPIVTKNLLILNGLFFVATFVFAEIFNRSLAAYLGLHYIKSELFGPWQIVTHMFMHGNIMHIAFNMFMLWMFGSTLENHWGPKRFLIFYFTTGFGAAIVHSLVQAYQINNFEDAVLAYQQSPGLEAFMNLYKQYVGEKIDKISFDNRFSILIAQWRSDPESTLYVSDSINLIGRRFAQVFHGGVVGASGAVYGLLMAFGLLFPNTYLLLFFIVPVKAKYAMMGLIAIALYLGFQNNPGDNVAHFAHLGGMLFGFLLLRYWNKNSSSFY